MNLDNMKIWKAVPVEGENADVKGDGKPGEIVAVSKDYVEVATGKGNLQILELQLEGKKRMSTHDFLLGVKMQAGEVLG